MADVMCRISSEVRPYIRMGVDGFLDLRTRAMLLYPAIADLTISHGKAAELLGISKWDLIELYANMGIPYVNQTWEEVEQDIRNIDIALQKNAEREAIRA
ncbi:MAG: UPF0175 family protein [Treponema sp.]|nr:UPF0175 family protein [Treponema sp.]